MYRYIWGVAPNAAVPAHRQQKGSYVRLEAFVDCESTSCTFILLPILLVLLLESSSTVQVAVHRVD